MRLDAGCERALVRVQALERRQERRVDIEQAALPAVDEPGREQPHETGKAHELDAMLVQHRLQRALEGSAILCELAVIDDRGRNPGGVRVRKALRIGTVGDDERDLGRIVGRLRGFDQRDHVGAAAGNEDGDALSRHPRHQARSRCPA